ncbi:variable large family protein, partial [Borreliella garinii]
QIAAALVLRGVAKGGKFAANAGGGESIGNVDAAGGANANAAAVKGIAGAMKGIVEAARKVEGVKFEPAAAAAAGGNGNKKAGKLFGTNAGADDAKEAAAAVGAVSGEQILSAIV